jgi:hypothetical protein
MALRAIDGIARRRVAVHLKPNGSYSLLSLSDTKDYQVFKWALALKHWCVAKRGR